MNRLIGLLICAVASNNAAAKDDVTPLFASDAPLAVEIEGPVREIARLAEKSTEARPATLRANGEALPVTIEARGNARRRKVTCAFPPLRVTLAGKAAETSLFDGQKSLKLVTHCRSGDSGEQQVLREYAAYRLWERLSPQSLKVRLLDVRYLDGGKEAARSVGFFIEDTDDAAKRMGMHEISLPDTNATALDRTAAARNALFQYMIGNNDFDMSNGPAGSDCCHNYKLIAASKDARTGLVPVPYDFDYAGLVDAPYAVPPEQLPITSVRQRYYRGCAWRAETLQAVPEFLAARPALLAELGRVPGLSARTRTAMETFLAGFFADLANPAATLFKRC